MAKSIYTLLILFVLSLYVNAQDTSIINDLNAVKAGQGRVTIYQDESIRALIGSPIQKGTTIKTDALASQLSSSPDSKESAPTKYIKTKGFRIQVYSGSSQKRSKSEAQDRRSTIRSAFPNMEVTVTYTSPVWRVKAGNFTTREQAQEALAQMKAKFPALGREMYIVTDVVKVPVE